VWGQIGKIDWKLNHKGLVILISQMAKNPDSPMEWNGTKKLYLQTMLTVIEVSIGSVRFVLEDLQVILSP